MSICVTMSSSTSFGFKGQFIICRVLWWWARIASASPAFRTQRRPYGLAKCIFFAKGLSQGRFRSIIIDLVLIDGLRFTTGSPEHLKAHRENSIILSNLKEGRGVTYLYELTHPVFKGGIHSISGATVIPSSWCLGPGWKMNHIWYKIVETFPSIWKFYRQWPCR